MIIIYMKINHSQNRQTFHKVFNQLVEKRRVDYHEFSSLSDVQSIEKEVKKGSTTTISCVITGITETVTVSWRTATEPVSGSKFNSVQGSHSGGTQTSTLTVDSSEVTEDKTYTCRLTSESFPDSGNFDNTVNLNVFGMFSSLLKLLVKLNDNF